MRGHLTVFSAREDAVMFMEGSEKAASTVNKMHYCKPAQALLGFLPIPR